MLPRKEWRPETVLKATMGVVWSWFLVMAGASLLSAVFKEQGREMPPLLLLVAAAVGFHGAGFAAVAWALRIEHRTWNTAFGLGNDPRTAIGVALVGILAVAPAVYGIHAGVSALMQRFGFEPESQSAVKLLVESGWPGRAVIAFFAVVLAPVVEELLFRGLFFPLLRDAGFPRLAWLGTALLFGLIHANRAAFLPLSILGLFLAWLYVRTGNLLAPIAAHALFNTIPFVMVILGWDLPD